MAIDMQDCFSFLAKRRKTELVVTSAGSSSEVWWETTGDLDDTFYLEASMSLSTMFAAGIAKSYPDTRFWAFVGDGAFVMNTGMLFVERAMGLPNMVSIVVANRCYAATDLPIGDQIDFAGIARASGISNVYTFDSLAALEAGFDEAFYRDGPTTVVLELEKPKRHYVSPPFDGPELKYRFGRALEKRFGLSLLP